MFSSESFSPFFFFASAIKTLNHVHKACWRGQAIIDSADVPLRQSVSMSHENKHQAVINTVQQY